MLNNRQVAERLKIKAQSRFSALSKVMEKGTASPCAGEKMPLKYKALRVQC